MNDEGDCVPQQVFAQRRYILFSGPYMCTLGGGPLALFLLNPLNIRNNLIEHFIDGFDPGLKPQAVCNIQYLQVM